MPEAAADRPWLTYRDGAKPLIKVDTYAQYVQGGHVYLNGVGREDLLPLLSLRWDRDMRPSTTYAFWSIHRTANIVRLGTWATFFPEMNIAYIKQRNGHPMGALVQYLMMKCDWSIYSFRGEVPQAWAPVAEDLAVPMHSWFKPRP